MYSGPIGEASSDADKTTLPSISTADGGSSFATLGQIFVEAEERLHADAWAVLDGGAGAEQTLRDNRAAFEGWSFRPRYMTGVTSVSLGTTFLGVNLELPIMTSPIGGDGLFHDRGQLAIVEAAGLVGTMPIVSEASGIPLEVVAEASPGPKMMQLHAWGQPDEFLALAERASMSGYMGLCVTVDCPTLGWRERAMERGFLTPARYWDANHASGNASAVERLGAGVGSPWTWGTLATVREQLDCPVIVKGVLTAEDAKSAEAAGMDGIIVSNHGGRQLDCLPATLNQLGEVVTAIAGRIPVGLDGGVRRGSDVLKALALGADVVLVGRVVAMALAAGGSQGVWSALTLLRSELERSMLLAGCDSLSQVDRSLLQTRYSRELPEWRTHL